MATCSPSPLLTAQFLLVFCVSQGTRGIGVDSSYLCIAEGPYVHSFHGPRWPSQGNATKGPFGGSNHLLNMEVGEVLLMGIYMSYFNVPVKLPE